MKVSLLAMKTTTMAVVTLVKMCTVRAAILVFLTRVIYLYISQMAALTVHIQRAHCNFKLSILL